MKAILGTKIGMTQIIQDDGSVIAVTIVKADPCIVTQLKSEEKDGYSSVQLSMPGAKNHSKSVAGHVAKVNKDLKPRMIREFRVAENSSNDDQEELKLGSSINVSNFEVGDVVKVTGTSKGKGFAGTVKRHNFKTSAKSHGGKSVVRRPGSIGSMYPQKIFKGKKMAGQMGAQRVTVKGLSVAYIDADNNLIGLKGAVPGPKKSLVTVVGE